MDTWCDPKPETKAQEKGVAEFVSRGMSCLELGALMRSPVLLERFWKSSKKCVQRHGVPPSVSVPSDEKI